MATTNRVKQKFARGEVAYGVWLQWLDPGLIEYYGLLGFDYVVIDGEHLAVDRSVVLELLRACELSGLVSIVRIPENNPATILGYLDLGVQGIYTPHVANADEARAIVRAVKYAPLGERGANQPRPAKYGLVGSASDYFKQANEDTMVIALIESVEGINSLDEVLAVDGIDVVGVGNTDLSHSMGFPGQKDHPEVRRVVDDAEARIAARRVVDAVVTDAAQAREAQQRGALMISLSDGGFLAAACRDYLKAARGAS
jgi:2-keto-3-deoxy-L-rhamnonate aldolase RhmA